MFRILRLICLLLLFSMILSLNLFAENKGIEFKDLALKFIHIPSGEFSMGQTDKEKKLLINTIGRKNYNRFSADERPVHKVFLDEYWIAETEITIKQFRAFISDTEYKTDAEKKGDAFVWTGEKWGKKKSANWKKPGFAQKENHPVVCVSWNDSKEFCKWLSKKTGYKVKLPTEAQWERAAGGDGKRIYPWGDKTLGGKFANYADKTCWNKYKLKWANKLVNDKYAATSPVGSYPKGKSPFGILDMAGNVWEWCCDTYSKNYYSKSQKNNPKGPSEEGTLKVLRGGGWGDSIKTLRKSKRFRFTSVFRADIVGFRPVIIKK